MSLPAPKLDDRTFDDLVQEAKSRILGTCPEWTDFNASDPGMTLVDLMAWMTELTLYRLNRVPERHYIKFLELMGCRLVPAEPARAWVTFNVGKPPEDPVVKPGKVLSTVRKGSEEPVVFETAGVLNLTTARLVHVFSRVSERETEHTQDLDGLATPAAPDASAARSDSIEPLKSKQPMFYGVTEMPHILYLMDSRLDFGDARLAAAMQLRVGVELTTPLGGPVDVEWELWDGTNWAAVPVAEDSTQGLRQSGALIFDELPRENAIPALVRLGVLDAKAAALLKEKKQNRYVLRARLVSALALREQSVSNENGEDTPDVTQDVTLPTLKSLTRNLEVSLQRPLLPDKLVHETPQPSDPTTPYVRYRELPSQRFSPFGPDPRAGDIFYLKSAAFARAGATVTLGIETSNPSSQADSPLLELVWEYFARGGTWKQLHLTQPEHGSGMRELSYGGRIIFTVPGDVEPCPLAGDVGPYIRARISSAVVGVDSVHGRPLQVDAVIVQFADPPANWEEYTAENYLTRVDLTADLVKPQPVRPFEIKPEKNPALYLGFSEGLLPNTLQRLYVSLAKRSDVRAARLKWEYSTSDGWAQLQVDDGTTTFMESGALQFIAPANWAATNVFSYTAHWLRCRSELDQQHPNAQLKGIYLNAVEVIQGRSFRDEILGSSTGKPLQTFRLIWTPILPGSEIFVREKLSYEQGELDQLRTQLGPSSVVQDGNGAWWVRWREVDSFYSSTKADRHYTLDPLGGVVTFGDGKRRGMVPPQGDNNIKATVYQQTTGARGNVAAKAIAVLEGTIDGVDKAFNPEPAEGGADAETIEDAVLRAPYELKARDRAVTPGDFEHLAGKASGQVAKAQFIEDDSTGRNEPVIVIVPEDPTRQVPADGRHGKLRPDGRLIRQVRQYLDARRLITTRLIVRGPEYQDIRLYLEVKPLSQYVDRFSELKASMKQRLHALIHPLPGPGRGPNGEGWPMGRTLHKSELYYVIESVPGVDYVDKLLMWKWAYDRSDDANLDRTEGEAEDSVRIDAYGLHYFRDIEIRQAQI